MTVIASGEIDLKLSKQSQAVLENDLAKASNQAGAKSGEEFGEQFNKGFSKKQRSVGEALGKAAKVAGPAITAIGGALTKLGQSSEKATINLRRAVENTGTSSKGFGKDLDGAIKQQAKFGTNSIDTTRVLTTLTQKLQDPKKALQALALASDLAAAKSISLEAATGLVTKAYSGNVKVLAQFGINVKDSKAAIEASTKAQEAHRTAIEKFKDAQQNLSDLSAVLGEKDKLSLQDQFRLRDAKQAVADAQANLNTAAQNSVGAQEAAKGAIAGTEEAVGKLRGQVKGLADEQAATLEGRLKTLRVQVQNVAIDLGDKFGPAITGVGIASTLAANAVTIGLTPALLGLGVAYLGAGAAGVVLGVGLHQLIEEFAPGVNRALESVGAKLYDFVTGNNTAKEAMGGLDEAHRIFNLTGERTTQNVDRQIRALSTLAENASGSTRAAIQALIEKLEAIHPEYRTEVNVDGVAHAITVVDDLRSVLDNVTKPRSVTVTVNTRAGNAQALFPGGPTTSTRPSNSKNLIPQFHDGGMFRAPTPGGVGLALLKDRETVLPPGQTTNSTVTNNVTVIDNTGDPRATANAVASRLGERSQR